VKHPFTRYPLISPLKEKIFGKTIHPTDKCKRKTISGTMIPHIQSMKG